MQRLADNTFHDQKWQRCSLGTEWRFFCPFDSKNCHHMRMTDSRRRTSFSQESLSRGRKPCEFRSQGFHSNDSLQLRITSPKNDPHAAAADLFKNLIRAKLAQRAQQRTLIQILAIGVTSTATAGF